MRRFFLPRSRGWIVAIMLALLAPAACADDVADLIATDKRQQRAYIDRDWQVLEEIFTDDYVLITTSGRTLTKRDVIDWASKPTSQWEINETSDWKVRVHGDTAILVARLHQKGVDDGQAYDSWVLFSDTYVRENGRWRNLHAQAIRLPDPK